MEKLAPCMHDIANWRKYCIIVAIPHVATSAEESGEEDDADHSSTEGSSWSYMG